jgi:hypothetical protein
MMNKLALAGAALVLATAFSPNSGYAKPKGKSLEEFCLEHCNLRRPEKDGRFQKCRTNCAERRMGKRKWKRQ